MIGIVAGTKKISAEMADEFDIEDFAALARFLADPFTNDRTMAIVATAYIEDYLGRLIRWKMPGLTAEIREKLFGANGAIGTMAAKIDTAKALDIIDAETRKDLIYIARIRNRFAHNLHVSDFGHPDVKTFIGKLTELIPMESQQLFNKTLRGRFHMCAQLRCMSLHNKLVLWLSFIKQFDEALISLPDDYPGRPTLVLARNMFRTVSS